MNAHKQIINKYESDIKEEKIIDLINIINNINIKED